jgi:hypothetical protein
MEREAESLKQEAELQKLQRKMSRLHRDRTAKAGKVEKNQGV